MNDINIGIGTFFDTNKQAIRELLDFPSIEHYRYRCSAIVLPQITKWEDNDLNIEYNEFNKTFSVKFKGTSANSNDLSRILEKEIPIRIAETSFCECGNKLSLGKHSIKIKNNDYFLEANFFCISCNLEIRKEKEGFKSFIKSWGFGISEINLDVESLESNDVFDSINIKYNNLIERVSKGGIKDVISQLKYSVFELKDEELIALWATISCKYNEIEEDNILGIIPSNERILLKSKLLQSLCHLIFSLKKAELNKC